MKKKRDYHGKVIEKAHAKNKEKLALFQEEVEKESQKTEWQQKQDVSTDMDIQVGRSSIT